MEQDLVERKFKKHGSLWYVAAAIVLLAGFLLFKYSLVLYVFLLVIVFLGAGLPTYVRYWKQGQGLEATLLAGALLLGGLLGVAWEQLN